MEIAIQGETRTWLYIIELKERYNSVRSVSGNNETVYMTEEGGY